MSGLAIWLAAMRVPAIVLWVMLMLRTYLGRFTITGLPEDVRKYGWFFFRGHIYATGFAIVLFLSPRDIMRIAQLIDQETAWMMGLAGVACLIAAAIYGLIGIDITHGKGFRGLPAYLGVVALGVALALSRCGLCWVGA